jgi:hypothetical protein
MLPFYHSRRILGLMPISDKANSSGNQTMTIALPPWPIEDSSHHERSLSTSVTLTQVSRF